MALVHVRDWAAATQAVNGYADPVAAKLVTFYRLLTPGAANADEIAAFALQNPDWPSQDQLERRRQEAIASDADQDRIRAQCGHGPIELPTALQRCAEAFAAARPRGERRQLCPSRLDSWLFRSGTGSDWLSRALEERASARGRVGAIRPPCPGRQSRGVASDCTPGAWSPGDGACLACSATRRARRPGTRGQAPNTRPIRSGYRACRGPLAATSGPSV